MQNVVEVGEEIYAIYVYGDRAIWRMWSLVVRYKKKEKGTLNYSAPRASWQNGIKLNIKDGRY